MDKYADGLKAELRARDYLEDKGYKIIERNIAYKNIGEIDIIAKDGAELVIVEVRYRSSNAFGHPLETLTRAKRNKIIRTTGCYLGQTKVRYSSIRFDVVAITDYGIEHIKNAFFSRWN